MLYYKLILFFIGLLSIFFNAKPIFAAAVISAPSDAPSEIQINQTFSFNSTLTSTQAGETYFVKCRLGQSGQSSSLNDGQTYNPTTNTWLFDTGAWVDMPTVTTLGNSITFSIQCRVKSGAISEQKVLYSRACLKKSDGTCGTGFQSSSGVNLLVNSEPAPSASPSPSPSPMPFSTSSTTSSSSVFTISNVPSAIDSTETFKVSVNLSLSNSPNTAFYLKGAFKKADSSNYFGLTKVSGSWIKNNKTYSDQYKITTDGSGSWSGNLEIQPDILDSGYEGGGDYIFKVGRYTDSGSLSWSNEVTVKINAQEVTTDEKDSSEVLGAVEKHKEQNKSAPSKDEEYSLEKYIKIATPASKAAVSPQAEVKGEKKTNYLSWAGTFMITAGIALFTYVYLRNRNLRETISNLFRKRN